MEFIDAKTVELDIINIITKQDLVKHIEYRLHLKVLIIMLVVITLRNDVIFVDSYHCVDMNYLSIMINKNW